MKENLSKYDVLSNKMNKLSKITISFVGAYALAFSSKKKIDAIKNLIDKFLYDAHILFEIKNDVINYLSHNEDDKIKSFLLSLNKTSTELEKILLLYIICKKKSDNFIYQIIIDFMSKKKTEEGIVTYLYENVDENDRDVLKLLSSEFYTFNELPQEYQQSIVNEHNKFMSDNINPYINKSEKEQIEMLKGIKIYNENIDIDLNIKINSSGRNIKY